MISGYVQPADIQDSHARSTHSDSTDISRMLPEASCEKQSVDLGRLSAIPRRTIPIRDPLPAQRLESTVYCSTVYLTSHFVGRFSIIFLEPSLAQNCLICRPGAARLLLIPFSIRDLPYGLRHRFHLTTQAQRSYLCANTRSSNNAAINLKNDG
jgi:hypothetical protein